jgi:hypothetical protein
MKAMLLKNGAKQAELDWMGFDEAFEGKATVSKAEVQQWIDENKIEVEEVSKGANDQFGVYEKSSGALIDVFDDKAEADAYAEFDSDREVRNTGDTRVNQETEFSDYQLPGGENYKEVLLTMPVKKSDISKAKIWADDKNWFVKFEDGTLNSLPLSKADDKYEAYDMVKSGDPFRSDGFKSSHFDERNIVAHIRFNERTDADGKSVLFIEEIQSDWAQVGRKKGFKGIPEVTDLVYIDYRDDLFEKYSISSVDELQGVATSNEIATVSELYKKENNGDIIDVGSTPNMPFKQTDQWVNLGLRRMIRYAAENGFNRIAWTTGEQQADRYDLSKQIDAVHYVQEDDGKYSFNAQKGDNEYLVIKNNITESDLEDNLGKELARKIINGEGTTRRGKDVRKGAKTLSGLDLKVGGEGMKAFYDQIVPKLAGKLGKKFGSKVEDVKVNTETEIFSDTEQKDKVYSEYLEEVDGEKIYQVYAENDNMLFTGTSDEVYDYAVDNNFELFNSKKVMEEFAPSPDKYLMKVNSLPITDKMYETAIGEGFPLFLGNKPSDFKTFDEYSKEKDNSDY